MGVILITGGLGFIGSNLSDYLLAHTDDMVIIYDNANRVNVLKNKTWLEHEYSNSSRLKIIQGDITDFDKLKESMTDVEKVYHLAGQVAVTNSIANPLEDFKINAEGTLNLLEIARQSETSPSLLLTSTNKVYGALEKLPIIDKGNQYDFKNDTGGIAESYPVDPHSPYGCSKLTITINR